MLVPFIVFLIYYKFFKVYLPLFKNLAELEPVWSHDRHSPIISHGRSLANIRFRELQPQFSHTESGRDRVDRETKRREKRWRDVAMTMVNRRKITGTTIYSSFNKLVRHCH